MTPVADGRSTVRQGPSSSAGLPAFRDGDPSRVKCVGDDSRREPATTHRADLLWISSGV